MFPHYMEVAGWLALAALGFAWIALAAYLSVVIARQSDAPLPRRRVWIVVLWLLPVVGVAAYLVRAYRPRAIVGHSSGRSRDQ